MTQKPSDDRSTQTHKPGMKLEYKILCDRDDILVFATPERVRYVALIRNAVYNSSTWAEFRRAMPRDEYSRVMLLTFDDKEEPRPKGSATFDVGAIVPSVFDGEYPPNLFAEMFHGILPWDMLMTYGFAVVQGECVFDPDTLGEIMAELRRRRYKLTPTLEQEMFHGPLPTDIMLKYGEEQTSGIGELWYTIDQKYLGEIKAELERRGYELIDGSHDESFLF